MKRKLKHKKRVVADSYARIDWAKAAVMFKNAHNERPSGQKQRLVKDVLARLAYAGAVGLVYMFNADKPGVERLLLGETKLENWRERQVIDRFAKQKFVTIAEHVDESVTLKITKLGMRKALTYQLDTMQLKRPAVWDKKWRVVIFDIPERYKRIRDVFRLRLKQLGMFQLQESVYVCPFPCFDEVEFLRELYGIPMTVKYVLAERIEDDEFLKDNFSL